MKKIVCLILMILLLVSMAGCQVLNEALIGAGIKEQESDTSGFDEMQAARAEQEAKDAAQPQADPATAEQPPVIPMTEVTEPKVDKPLGSINSDEEAERIGRKHFAELWPGEVFDPKYDIEPYRYACEVSLKHVYLDVDKKNIADLDAPPYNMYAADNGTSDMTHFMTNRQLVEKYGYKKVEQYAIMATTFVDTYTMYDPDYPTEKRKADYETVTTPELAEILANRPRTSGDDAWFKQDTYTFWATPYVYMASNGWLRARMRMAIILRDASDAFFAENPEQKETVGQWHVHDFEVAMNLDENEKIAEYAVFELDKARGTLPDEAKRLDDAFKKATGN